MRTTMACFGTARESLLAAVCGAALLAFVATPASAQSVAEFYTGKTVNVVVNDRGPFVRGVSLDLSLGAAQAIGLQGTGSVCIL